MHAGTFGDASSCLLFGSFRPYHATGALTLFLNSILYKTKLPFILVFNKTDVAPHDFALEWMHDFEAFSRALAEHGSQRGSGGYGDGEPSYMDSLMNSMSLVLDEFYNTLTVSLSVYALLFVARSLWKVC